MYKLVHPLAYITYVEQSGQFRVETYESSRCYRKTEQEEALKGHPNYRSAT